MRGTRAYYSIIQFCLLLFINISSSVVVKKIDNKNAVDDMKAGMGMDMGMGMGLPYQFHQDNIDLGDHHHNQISLPPNNGINSDHDKLEYITYQFEGVHHQQGHQHHQQQPQQHQLHHPSPPIPPPALLNNHGPNQFPHNGGGAYPVPVPVPVPVRHNEQDDHPHHHHHHELEHLTEQHHHHPHHSLTHYQHNYHDGKGLQIKKLLIPLAGIAILGAAAAIASNPVLLQLGVINGKKRRRRSMPMEHRTIDDQDLEDIIESTTMLPNDDNDEKTTEKYDDDIEKNTDSAFGNLTKLADNENELGLRMREIMILEEFLKQQTKQTERRSGPIGPADGVLASLLTCSGLMNSQNSRCLQQIACEAYSEETELPQLELQVIKIVLHELLTHEAIPDKVKALLRSAVSAGLAGHRCSAIFRCPAKAWTRCTDPSPKLNGIKDQFA